MNLVSVIVPCFNEEEALPYFYDEIVKISKLMQDVDFEFIFVNDGSKDKTLSVIKNLAKNDSRVKYISFSRNFGKEAAIYAGFQNCIGDYAVLMDADLQDPPHLLPEMYKAIVEEVWLLDVLQGKENHLYDLFLHVLSIRLLTEFLMQILLMGLEIIVL